MPTTTDLWRKNQVTGLWKHERTCELGTAHQWLLISQKEEPDAQFKLSPSRPKD